MKSVRVIWSEPAKMDVLGIVDFIAAEIPAHAERNLARLEARAATLNHTPARGRVVPELRAQGITTIREVIERPWRIVYEFDGNAVTAIGVFDNRRNLDSMLMERYLQL